jgi:hypothetical protein
MRAKVAGSLRKEFETVLRNALPRVERDTESVLPPGWRCYRLGSEQDLHYFVLLGISPQFEDFVVTCIWNTRPLLPDTTGAEIEEQSGEFALHHLQDPRRAYGWTLTPGAGLGDLFDPYDEPWQDRYPVDEAVARVPAAVAEAIELLVEAGLPALERLARIRGRNLEDLDSVR